MLAILLVVAVAPWAGPAAVDGVGVDVSDAARSDAITVTGVFERLALDAADAADAAV